MATVKSTQAMAGTLKDVGKAMHSVNKQLNLPELQSVMRDFARETDRLGLTEEMMSDAIDMAVDDPNMMGETDDVVNQILGEIGIDIAGELETGPVSSLKRQQEEEVKQVRSQGLEDRFNAL
jgi:charged multivesicular body protein 2A